MSELLQIEKDKVLVAFKNGTPESKATLTELFPALLKTDLLKSIFTFEDVCKKAGRNLDDFVITASMTDEEIHEVHSRKIKLVYKVFNEDWTPDFSDEDERKYYPWFEFKEGTGFVLYHVFDDYGLTVVGSRLCSYSEEIVRHICKHFLKEYNSYLLS